ncbi:MAG: hypothetical protein M3Y59_02020, partial [Myxococcota bacterium]|nr:hypothetical protein [Myxococcota bacterium]
EQTGIGGAGQAGAAAQPAAPAPLTGIDYGTSTSSLGPIFPGSATPLGQQQAGQVGYPALGGAALPQTTPTPGTATATQVGTPGVPGASAVSPGSPTGLSGISDTQVSPGIPASPPVLNNGAFPPALQGGNNTTTPGIPASNPVLNNGQSLLGQPATPNRVTGAGTTGTAPTATGTGTGTPGNTGGSTGTQATGTGR